MYKDKAKQKEANRKAQAKFKASKKVLPSGITKPGITRVLPQGITGTVTPEGIKVEVPANYGQPDCQCMQCQRLRCTSGSLISYNHGAYKKANSLGQWELNRTALPGDVDYVGVVTELLKKQGTGQWLSKAQIETM